jgi:hypothetical protein
MFHETFLLTFAKHAVKIGRLAVACKLHDGWHLLDTIKPWSVHMASDIEASMVAVERVQEYANLTNILCVSKSSYT